MSDAMHHQVPIDTHTRLVGLLGQPLGHSLSPAMHNRAFHTRGLNFCYLPIELADEDLAAVTAGIARMNFAGYNVTIPHKIRIMEYLDAVDPLARAIGAVNTVTLKNGRATGYNTDGIGFVHSLEADEGVSVRGKTVLLLGCGGAARAIAMTLAQQGAGRIVLSNRTESKAHALAEDVSRLGRARCHAIPLHATAMETALGDTDILVNTTSVGMQPREERMPIETRLLHGGLVVCDIVYNPARTCLLAAAEKRGCRVVGGIGMLVYQGAAAFRMWTGQEAPISAMFAALGQGPRDPLNHPAP